MPVISHLITRLYHDVLLLKVWIILLLILGYLASSWLFFYLAGEVALTEDLITFLYFAATTASTVGYGDLSPVTKMGQLIASVFFFPVAVTIFTITLSKITVTAVERVRRMADGHGNYSNRKDATVLIGYHDDRTERMIEDLIAGKDDDHTIILVSRHSDPQLPNNVYFVHSDKIDSIITLKRAGVENAAKLLIYADSDSETFNCCLAVRELNASVHIAAYFNDRETAKRAEKFANVETVVSVSSETLVRAAQDPGSSAVIQALASSTDSATIYSQIINQEIDSIALIQNCLSQNINPIAVKITQNAKITFAPFPAKLSGGDQVFYIADSRPNEIVWAAIQKEPV